MLRRAAAAAARGWQGSASAGGACSRVHACSATEHQAFWHAKSAVRRMAEQASKEEAAARGGWFKVSTATALQAAPPMAVTNSASP